MTSQTSPLDQFLASLSAAELRDVIRRLVTTYENRRTDAVPEQKLAGREAQRAMAKLLADRDADWIVREVLLNLGRTLYDSTQPRHDYYGEGLIVLCERLGRALEQTDLGEKVVAALRHLKALSEGGGLFEVGAPVFTSPQDISALMAANATVLRQASALVNEVLDNAADTISRSEARMLSGIVDTNTKLRLKAL